MVNSISSSIVPSIKSSYPLSNLIVENFLYLNRIHNDTYKIVGICGYLSYKGKIDTFIPEVSPAKFIDLVSNNDIILIILLDADCDTYNIIGWSETKTNAGEITAQPELCA